MAKKSIVNQALNKKFEVFARQMMIVRLVNAGQSNLSDKQSELVAKAFDNAYQLLVAAKSRGDKHLFKRVYNMTYELVPSSAVTKVMKYPRMYQEMVNAQMDFNVKVTALLKHRCSIR